MAAGIPTTVVEAVDGSSSGTTVSIPIGPFLGPIIAGLIVAAMVAAAKAVLEGLEFELRFTWPPIRSRRDRRPDRHGDDPDAEDPTGTGGG